MAKHERVRVYAEQDVEVNVDEGGEDTILLTLVDPPNWQSVTAILSLPQAGAIVAALVARLSEGVVGG